MAYAFLVVLLMSYVFLGTLQKGIRVLGYISNGIRISGYTSNGKRVLSCSSTTIAEDFYIGDVLTTVTLDDAFAVGPYTITLYSGW
jgi:hypothetical protein